MIAGLIRWSARSLLLVFIVTLGLIGGGRAEIASGLAEGESVVARAGTFVRDGDMITPIATN